MPPKGTGACFCPHSASSHSRSGRLFRPWRAGSPKAAGGSRREPGGLRAGAEFSAQLKPQLSKEGHGCLFPRRGAVSGQGQWDPGFPSLRDVLLCVSLKETLFQCVPKAVWVVDFFCLLALRLWPLTGSPRWARARRGPCTWPGRREQRQGTPAPARLTHCTEPPGEALASLGLPLGGTGWCTRGPAWALVLAAAAALRLAVHSRPRPRPGLLGLNCLLSTSEQEVHPPPPHWGSGRRASPVHRPDAPPTAP